MRKMLKSEKEKSAEWYYDYSSSLYIYFDNKILYSCYREPASYEDYVPKNWIFEYKEFLDDVPKDCRYWSDKKNKDYFQLKE